MNDEIIMDKYKIHGKHLLDLETGEVLSNKEAKIILDMYVKFKHKEIVAGAIEVDVELDTRIVKARTGESFHVINIKEDYEFTRMFKVDVRDMMKDIKMSIYARAFMHDAMSYLRFPTNTLIHNSHNPDIDELCKLMDMKRSKLYDVLKELESKGVIIREKLDNNLIIYVNPFLYSCGLVDINTYEKFKENSFNPFKK